MRSHLPFVVLLALAGCGGESALDRPRARNLLLVSIDTLRADRLGSYGNDEWGRTPSPRIDALAAEGVLFQQAYAPRGETHPSLASLVTGKYPITTGVRENGYALPLEHETLLERLRAAGWRTGAFLANFEIAHRADAWVARGAHVAGDGFGGRRRDETDDTADFQALWDERVEQAALAFLDETEPGRPFALWVHFYDVHKPFNPPQEWFAAYGDAAALPEGLRASSEAFPAAFERHLAAITLGDRPVPEDELRRIRGLYDGSITSTDERLGRLRDRLAARGMAGDTLVVLTSDHGEELFDRNRYFFHGCSIAEGVVRVPLVVAGPGLARGLRQAAHVAVVDVAPTVLELLGLPAAADMEGRSLVPLLTGASRAPPAPFAHLEWQDLIYAVTDGRHKLIFNPKHCHPRHSPYGYPGVPESLAYRIDCLQGYDLSADPREQVNLLAGVDLARLPAGLPDPFGALYRALQRWLADPRHQTPMRREGFDDDELERMRQLGYIGIGTATASDYVLREPCP